MFIFFIFIIYIIFNITGFTINGSTITGKPCYGKFFIITSILIKYRFKYILIDLTIN